MRRRKCRQRRKRRRRRRRGRRRGDVGIPVGGAKDIENKL